MDLQKILAGIRRSDEEYHLIEDGDRIAVGVSGGKDSMVLLAALAMYSRFKGKRFEVIGIHIEVGFPGMNFDDVHAFCRQHQIEFHVIPSKIYNILKLHEKEERLQCSLCAKLKKGAIIKEAKALNCNKLAFGHHSDDAVETLFLNMIHGGRIATFPPIMHLSRQDFTFIRPMIYCYEEDILNAQIKNAIPFVKSTCPNDGHTQRQEMKELLANIYQTYPQAKNNFLLSLHNLEQIELWEKDIRLSKEEIKQKKMENLS